MTGDAPSDLARKLPPVRPQRVAAEAWHVQVPRPLEVDCHVPRAEHRTLRWSMTELAEGQRSYSLYRLAPACYHALPPPTLACLLLALLQPKLIALPMTSSYSSSSTASALQAAIGRR